MFKFFGWVCISTTCSISNSVFYSWFSFILSSPSALTYFKLKTQLSDGYHHSFIEASFYMQQCWLFLSLCWDLLFNHFSHFCEHLSHGGLISWTALVKASNNKLCAAYELLSMGVCSVLLVQSFLIFSCYFDVSEKPVMYSSGTSGWTPFRPPQQVISFSSPLSSHQIMAPATSASSSVSQQDFLGELRRQMHSANPSFTTWWLAWIV